jgi:hypothetical protein
MAPRPRLADAAYAYLGFRVARTMHGRWRRMRAGERSKLEGLADDVKERALELRGTPDREGAGRDLNAASTRLAEAMVESAQADPEFSDIQVAELRSELARELDRLASGDISASRGEGHNAPNDQRAPGPGDVNLHKPL